MVDLYWLNFSSSLFTHRMECHFKFLSLCVDLIMHQSSVSVWICPNWTWTYGVGIVCRQVSISVWSSYCVHLYIMYILYVYVCMKSHITVSTYKCTNFQCWYLFQCRIQSLFLFDIVYPLLMTLFILFLNLQTDHHDYVNFWLVVTFDHGLEWEYNMVDQYWFHIEWKVISRFPSLCVDLTMHQSPVSVWCLSKLNLNIWCGYSVQAGVHKFMLILHLHLYIYTLQCTYMYVCV